MVENFGLQLYCSNTQRNISWEVLAQLNDQNFKKIAIEDSNGHEWFEIVNRPQALIGKIVCKKCGYMRRIDQNGNPLNKACNGPVKIALR